jgi:hypothetical protein
LYVWPAGMPKIVSEILLCQMILRANAMARRTINTVRFTLLYVMYSSLLLRNVFIFIITRTSHYIVDRVVNECGDVYIFSIFLEQLVD